MTWSPGDVDVGIQSLLVQFYPILLSTLLSINRQQLSLLDAEFALTLSSSPLTIYLVFTSICDLCGIQTGLYKRIKSHRLVIRTFGALILLIWTGLSMACVMSTTAFKDSPCGSETLIDWLWATIMYFCNWYLHPGGVGGPFSTVFLLIFCSTSVVLFGRRRSQVEADVKLHSEGASGFRVFCTWVKFTWCVPVDVGPRLANLMSSRCTIDRNHKWYTYYVFAYFDICWALRVISLAILASEDEYVLSYGQVRVPCLPSNVH